MKSAGQRKQSYEERALRSSHTQVDPPPYGNYFVYSSAPTVSHADRSRKPKPGTLRSVRSRRERGIDDCPCHNSHGPNIRTKGAHDFYNMMWDPSVYRGNTYKTFQTAEMERCLKKKARDDLLVKKRKFPKSQMKIGGIVRPDLQQENLRVGLGDMGIQTEKFLEELTFSAATREMCTQVDPTLNNTHTGNFKLHQYSVGVETGCQTDCDLTCPFGPNAMQIQKTLSTKILEQSLLETAEETELEMLRRLKRNQVERRREEAFKTKMQIYAVRAAEAASAAAMTRERHEAKLEHDAENRVGATLFSAACMGSLIATSLTLLRRTLSGAETQELQESVDEDVIAYLKEGRLAARRFLDALLLEVAAVREAQTSMEFIKHPPKFMQRKSSHASSNFDRDHLHDDIEEPEEPRKRLSSLPLPVRKDEKKYEASKSHHQIHQTKSRKVKKGHRAP